MADENGNRTPDAGLQYVPDDLRSPEISRAAATQHPFNLDPTLLQYVRKQSPEIDTTLFPQMSRTSSSLSDMTPEELEAYKKEVLEEAQKKVLAAIKKGIISIDLVPSPLRTKEVFEEAIKHDKFAFMHMPEEFQTPENCLEAVKRCAMMLSFVRDDLMTKDLCLEAIKWDPHAFKSVPEAYKTPEFISEAIQANGMAIQFVKDPTQIQYLEAIKQNPYAITLVPPEKQTLPMAIAVMKQDPKFRYHLADQFRTEDFFKGIGFHYTKSDLATPQVEQSLSQTMAR